MIEQNSPLTVLRDIQRNAPEWARLLPEMPGLVHQFLATGANGGTVPSGIPVGRYGAVGVANREGRTDKTSASGLQTDGIVYAICAAGLFICATLVTLLGSSELLRVFGVPLWAWLIFILAVWCLRRAFKLADVV